jgi:hypothetical protein
VRPHSNIHEPFDFPLVNVGLEGPLAAEMLGVAFEAAHASSKEDSPGGFMFRTGAFRCLIAYLERELPKRGFTHIFIESVENKLLGLAAERYGFQRTGNRKAPDYVKLIGANLAS